MADDETIRFIKAMTAGNSGLAPVAWLKTLEQIRALPDAKVTHG